MARLFHWYTGQLVTQQDMRAGDVALEKGDHDVLVDLEYTGIIDGFEVTEQSPQAFAVDVASGLAHTSDGTRVQSHAPVEVDLEYDFQGLPTLVLNMGQSRILSLFVVPARTGLDPRLDAMNNAVYYRQDEFFAIAVVAGNESVGTPVPPPLLSDGTLIADITYAYDQIIVTQADISIVRRQDTMKLTGTPFGMSGTGGIYGTIPDAIQAIVTRYNALINGTGDVLASASVPYAGSGTWYGAIAGIGAGTTEAAIDAVVSSMAGSTAGTAGSDRIGVPADVTTVVTIPASSITSRFITLRYAAHHLYAGGPAWVNFAANGANTVEDALDLIIADLSSIAGIRGSGGQKIGMGSLGNFTASSVSGYFAELVATSNGNDGALRVGAQATGGFSGSTVRAHLDELRAGGTFTGAVTVSGLMTCSAGLVVTGAATVSTTLGVTGATTLSSTLGVAGAVTCSAALSVGTTLTCTGAATFNGTCALVGAVTQTGSSTYSGSGAWQAKRYTNQQSSPSSISISIAEDVVSLGSPTLPTTVDVVRPSPGTAAGTMITCYVVEALSQPYVFQDNGTTMATIPVGARTPKQWVSFLWNGTAWEVGPAAGTVTIAATY